VAGTKELLVPDLGDFSDVEVIEVLVVPGDMVAIEDSLVTLETDKATMDVPASHAGTVISVNVEVGAKVNAGDVVVTIEATEEDAAPIIESTVIIEPEEQKAILAAVAKSKGMEEAPLPDTTHFAELVVIGAGPGGYTAAFRAADLGMKVILIERWPVLGLAAFRRKHCYMLQK
jgi:dihydrolipoamide dehydrogenase